MNSRLVLIIETDLDQGKVLRNLIAGWDYQAVLEQSCPVAPNPIAALQPAAIIAGNANASPDAFSQLRLLKSHYSDVPIVLLHDSGSIEMALSAIKDEGAYHYFEKPVDANKLRVVLDRAVELSEAKRENELLRRQLQDRGAFGELVGNSAPMREIYSLIEQVAPSSASVLITGESGTGK
ncbi:MAG: sigma 54-interacting transcriptional regulator, partial [Pyrinomonadaceae bacterium]